MRYKLGLKEGLTLLFVLFCTIKGFSDETPIIVEIPGIPTNLDSFLALRDRLSLSPEGGASMFIVSMVMYTQNQNLGQEAFTISLDRFNLVTDPSGYKGYSPSQTFMLRAKNYLEPRPYIAFSYLMGTSPESRYVLPKKPYKIMYSTNAYSYISDTEVKLFVHSTGSETPRPIVLKKNNRGLWKVKSHSLFLGVLAPTELVDDDL
ncbi:DUF6935 domain-containing protein [Spirochaeta cellobiosiphila]|uniref:DUF6935 domain-containing protein n=1 Tax=Spirochaeta cellobiosiphila TaxID=504483 RepID=UPI00040BDB99|nr:hypothetical protein [Spirochaeta cellobiosiphila]